MPPHAPSSDDDSRVRAVLLDGLGTLLALEPPWTAFAEELRRGYGVELSAAEAEWAFASEMAYYRAHHHEGRDRRALAELRGRCAEVLRASLPPSAARALSRRQLTAAMLGALRFSVHADALATLPLLRARGLTLIVVSNWDTSLASVLGDLGLAGFFDGVLTSAGIGRPKPAPDLFLAALALAGVPAGQALHVGDDPREDILGARAAGIPAVLLRRAGPGASAARAAPGASAARTAPGASTALEPAGVPTIRSLAQLPRFL
jgi:HAD superfamily hydrolase (TIGR01509 family)